MMRLNILITHIKKERKEFQVKGKKKSARVQLDAFSIKY